MLLSSGRSLNIFLRAPFFKHFSASLASSGSLDTIWTISSMIVWCSRSSMFEPTADSAASKTFLVFIFEPRARHFGDDRRRANRNDQFRFEVSAEDDVS